MVANEIPFLSWTEFRRMAPPILQLEITRLTRLIEGCPTGSDVHSALVKARFELKQFVTCLEHVDKNSIEPACAAHLSAALLALAVNGDDLSCEAADTRRYIIERIQYMHDRIGLIY